MSDIAQRVDPVLIGGQETVLAAPAAGPAVRAVKPVSIRISACLRELWQASEAVRYGISEVAFAETLTAIGEKYHYGRDASADVPAESIQIDFLRSLQIADLALAQACAAGSESAWERLLEHHREMIHRAACAITREESSGRELADSICAWLYGMKEHNGSRVSPLASYTGRGTLAGWMRTVLVQRFVDEYRRTRRETSLDEQEETQPLTAVEYEAAADQNQLAIMARATSSVLSVLCPEDSFLLACYYLDRWTLQRIAQLLKVHESTVSRKLTRLTRDLRKELLRQLRSMGLSRRAAEEALGIDVRDVDIDIRKALQIAAGAAFPEQKRAEDGIRDE